jgi:hypothetical protein
MERYAITKHKESGILKDGNDWLENPLTCRSAETYYPDQLENCRYRQYLAFLERT